MCWSLGWVLKILVNQEGRFCCWWGLDTLEGTDKIQANTRTYYTITNCVSPLEETNSFAYYSLYTKVSFSPSPWHLRFFWDSEMKINGHGTISKGRNGLLRLCIKTRALYKGAHSCFTTVLRAERHHLHFTDEHTEVKRPSDFPEVTRLAKEAGFELGFV